MATEILMPALSPTMEEGTLAKWLVKEGDTVKSGDILAEIETDKATMEFEAVDEGVIGRIMVSEGTQGVKVNTPIAVLVEEGESVDDAAGASKPSAAPAVGAGSASPAAEERAAAEKGYGGPIGAPVAGDGGAGLTLVAFEERRLRRVDPGAAVAVGAGLLVLDCSSGVVEGTQHARDVAHGDVGVRSFAERTQRLALEVEEHPPALGHVEHLTEVVVAVDALERRPRRAATRLDAGGDGRRVLR